MQTELSCRQSRPRRRGDNRLAQQARSVQNPRPIPKRKDPLMPIGASLHIGLNAVDPKEYSGWDGELTACEFDANDMQALAKAQGFTKVTNRLTKRATRSRVLADIKAAAETEPKRHLFSHLFGPRRPGAEHGERFRA